MSQSSPELAARALDLVLAIDRLRDTASDERELAPAVAATLADALGAELALLCLVDDDTGELQMRAVVDRAEVLGQAEAEAALRGLAAHAAASATPEARPTQLTLGPGRTYHCLAGPLRVGGESLGAVLVLNADRPFDGVEQQLATHALSQIDTAMQHARTVRELSRRQRELETIYRIDRLRDQTPELQGLLDGVLAEVCSALAAEMAFVMLYDGSGEELELRATTHHDLFAADATAQLMRDVSEQALAEANLVTRAFARGPVQAVAGVPLILREKLIGVLGVVNSRQRPGGARPGFSRSDQAMLRAIASQMDTAIFESLQAQRLRGAFGQCVGPRVMERLLSIGNRDLLCSERRVITALFSDIRGFTAMAEAVEADLLQAALNDHLSALTDLVLAFEGTLDKYIGDSVMTFFNAPEDQPDHAERAVRLALEMQRTHQAVMQRWQGQLPLPPIGIGLSTGPTLVGNLGSERRLEYTAIGPDVNLAARLCAAAAGNQVLISASTQARVAGKFATRAVPPLALKGFEGQVPAWEVVDRV
jgi:class 3 adenylate cyclase